MDHAELQGIHLVFRKMDTNGDGVLGMLLGTSMAASREGGAMLN